jgi:hypothetical protein
MQTAQSKLLDIAIAHATSCINEAKETKQHVCLSDTYQLAILLGAIAQFENMPSMYKLKITDDGRVGGIDLRNRETFPVSAQMLTEYETHLNDRIEHPGIRYAAMSDAVFVDEIICQCWQQWQDLSGFIVRDKAAAMIRDRTAAKMDAMASMFKQSVESREKDFELGQKALMDRVQELDHTCAGYRKALNHISNEEIEDLKKKLERCRGDMQNFVDRCNEGSIRSVTTKERFEKTLKDIK